MTMTSLQRCQHFGVANIRGMAYMPGPSDYTEGAAGLYAESDFYNNIFALLWGNGHGPGGNQGRGDLLRFRQQLGINFIHCYDWAAPVDWPTNDGPLQLTHLPFLKACNALGMKATLPISNYTMGLLSRGKVSEAKTNFGKIIAEAYGGTVPNPAIGMWKIFNEYELNYDGKPTHVVTVMSWIAEWEASNNIPDANRLPIMVCDSFGVSDGIPGAGYLNQVFGAMIANGPIGGQSALDFWKSRIVFATNPQNDGAFITTYLSTSLPKYWASRNIPAPPVMFTELGSNIQQTGSEAAQAQVLSGQIAASKPGKIGNNGSDMLGACIFLNEERPWATGAERSFGITKFGPDTTWPFPNANFRADTSYPVWNPEGFYWRATGVYPVEQQAPKPNYQSVAAAWKST